MAEPAPTTVSWLDAAACASRPTANMYRASRATEKRRLCLACPILDVCLWSTMCDERAESFRFGIAGGLTAPERDRLALKVPPTLWDAAFVEALSGWKAEGYPTTPVRLRVCRCGTVIRQGLAGQPRRWCSDTCKDAHRARASRAFPVDAPCATPDCPNIRAPKRRFCRGCVTRQYRQRKRDTRA